jgi:hypothetical protein
VRGGEHRATLVEEIPVVKIRKVDPASWNPLKAPRAPSPRTQARLAQEELLRRSLISKLTGPDEVFEVRLESGEKATTIRQRLLNVAKDQQMDIAVSVRGDVLLVGLETPERRSRRGRRPKAKS